MVGPHTRLWSEQLSPQPPQMAFVYDVSQPSSVAGFEQSEKPMMQYGSQLPLLQSSESTFVLEHLCKQVPQLFGSINVSASQPLAIELSQSENPFVHW